MRAPIRINLLLIILWSFNQFIVSQNFFEASHPAFQYIGRTDHSISNAVRFDWPGIYLRCGFTGEELTIHLKGGERDYYNVFIDHQLHTILHSTTDSLYKIENIKGRGNHELMISKRTEADMGVGIFYGITLSGKGELFPSAIQLNRKIEFIGNSITCGYGTEGLSRSERFKPETENSYKSFAPITSRALNADYSLVAHSGIGLVRNYNDKAKISTTLATMPLRYGRTLDTDTTLQWDFNRWKPDAVVINLGTNDYSTLPHPDKIYFQRRYEQLIDRIRKLYGNITVVCMVGPMTNEPCYSTVKEVIDSYKIMNPESKVYFLGIPSGLLNPEKDYGSDGHPNYRGNKKTAQFLVPLLSNLLEWNYNDLEMKQLD
jgi:lysophospholipase L1-like esterase